MTTKYISIEKLVENFNKLKNLSEKEIIKAYKEKVGRLNEEERKRIYKVVEDIEYSRDLCKYLGIKYWDIRIIDEIKLIIALSDCFI